MVYLPHRSWTAIALTLLQMLSLESTYAMDGTRTLVPTDYPLRRHTLAKRARAYQCGQVKSNSAQYPNACICFDTARTSVQFWGEHGRCDIRKLTGFQISYEREWLGESIKVKVPCKADKNACVDVYH